MAVRRDLSKHRTSENSSKPDILALMLNAFGLIAVSATLLFYALEDRSPMFVLAFAGGCVASAVYGFLQGAWPFGLIEIAWTVVAVRRWHRLREKTG